MNSFDLKCPSCKGESPVEVFHAGFSDAQFCYCSQCPTVNVLEIYGKGGIKERGFYARYWFLLPFGRLFERKLVSSMGPCSCGGKFSCDAVPRCPKCNQKLEAGVLSTEICLALNLGKWNGWRDRFCFIFSGKKLKNHWKAA